MALLVTSKLGMQSLQAGGSVAGECVQWGGPAQSSASFECGPTKKVCFPLPTHCGRWLNVASDIIVIDQIALFISSFVARAYAGSRSVPLPVSHAFAPSQRSAGPCSTSASGLCSPALPTSSRHSLRNVNSKIASRMVRTLPFSYADAPGGNPAFLSWEADDKPMIESNTRAPDAPKRICIFVEPSPFTYVSGYKNRFTSMIKYLVEAGCEVMVVTTGEHQSLLAGDDH